MAYSAVAVANAFIEKALKGELKELTPMKLQKLLFYTQSWHLKLRGGTPLFDDLFARWKFGPVSSTAELPQNRHRFFFMQRTPTTVVPHLPLPVESENCDGE